MVNFLLTAAPRFPTGTVVGAYPKRSFAGPPPTDGEIAGGAPLAATATVDELGFALFEGLEAESQYYAGAQVNGVWHWAAFTSKPEAVDSADVEELQTRVTAIEVELGTSNPPAIQNPGPQSVIVGSADELLLSILNASTSEVAPLPAGMSYDPVGKRVKGTPTSVQSVQSTIRASGPGGSSEAQFVWTVAAAPAPVITKPADQVVEVGQPVSLQVLATNTVSYAAVGLPVGLSISPATGLVSGTPTAVEAPETTLKVTGPSGGTAESKFGWTVTSAVTAPTLLQGEPEATGTATEKTAPAPPTGTVNADLLLFLVKVAHGSALQTVSTPAGCTLIGTHGSLSAPSFYSFYVFSRPYEGVVMPTFEASESVEWTIRTMSVRGGVAVNQVAGFNNGESSGSISIPSVTTTVEKELVIALLTNTTGKSMTTPAGWSLPGPYKAKLTMRPIAKTLTEPGASGVASSVLGEATPWTVLTMAITPVAVSAGETMTAVLSADKQSVEPTFLPVGTVSISVLRATSESGEGGVSEVVPASTTKVFGTQARRWVSLRALNAGGEAIGLFTAPLKTTPVVLVPVVTKPVKQTGSVGKVVSLQIVATESPTSYTLTTAPTGLTINSSGLISGTLEAAGVFHPKVTATNSAGTSVSVEWEWEAVAVPIGPETGLAMNSDYESAPSLAAIALAPGKPVRVEFEIGTAASVVKGVAEKMAARGVTLQPLAGFQARIPSQVEAQGLKAWAEALAPLGVKYIEFGNETNYPNQLANTKGTGEIYGHVALQAAEALEGTGVKLLVQGADAGSGQHVFLDGIFKEAPTLHSLPSFGGWTIHAYPNSKVQGEKDTFGVPMLERFVKALEEKSDTVTGIFSTEWGAPTTATGLTMTSGQSLNWAEGAAVLEGHLKLLEMAARKRLVQVLIFQAHDQQPDTGTDTNREHFFGVLQSGGANKGAFTSFATTFLQKASVGPAPNFAPLSLFTQDATTLARASAEEVSTKHFALKLANQFNGGRKAYDYKNEGAGPRFFGYAGVPYYGVAENFRALINTFAFSGGFYRVPANQGLARVYRVKLGITKAEEEKGEGVMTKAEEEAEHGGKGVPYGSTDFLAVPMPLNSQVPGGTVKNQVWGEGTDKQVSVWQPNTDTLWEMWNLKQFTAGPLKGQWCFKLGARIQKVSQWNGINVPETGVRACKLSAQGGNILISDLVRVLRGGQIGHALSINIPVTKGPNGKGFLPPASSNDSQSVIANLPTFTANLEEGKLNELRSPTAPATLYAAAGMTLTGTNLTGSVTIKEVLESPKRIVLEASGTGVVTGGTYQLANPALKEAGAIDAVSEGAWFAFPAGTTAAGVGINVETEPLAAAIYEAIRLHGIYVSDGQGGGCGMKLQDPRVLGSPFIDQVNPFAGYTGFPGAPGPTVAKMNEYVNENVPAAWTDGTLPVLKESLEGSKCVLYKMPWWTLEQLAPRSS